MTTERVFEILGGERNLIRKVPSKQRPVARLNSLRKQATMARGAMRFRTQSVERLSAHLEYPKSELLDLLNVRGRTAQRREQEGALSEDESDRLYRIARLAQKAEFAFGSAEKARSWLKRPSVQFNGHTPLSLLGSDAGAEEVADELTRIEFGDLY